MRTLKKLLTVLTFAAMILGNAQIFAAPQISTPQISIGIPILRGPEDFNLLPHPGFSVTLLANQNVHFAWATKAAKNFVVVDGGGKKIFEQSLGGKNSLDIVPGKIKLKSGQKYSWSVDGNINVYEFTILDAQSEKIILDGIAAIDAKNLSPEESAVEKSKFVQQLSEEHPEKFDLYWLSAQWLCEISTDDEKIKAQIRPLLEKCSQHLDAER